MEKNNQKIKIHLIHNTLENKWVTIQNIGSCDYLNPRLPLSVGEEKQVETGIAKHYFGDWDNPSYGEQKRRESLNIHLLDVTVEIVEIEKKITSEENKKHEKKIMEKEFEDLTEKKESKENKKQEKKITVMGTCQGKTKSGKPCQAKATNGDYCGNHYPKE